MYLLSTHAKKKKITTLSVFGNIVVGAFQITFRVKIYINNFFIFKKLFLTSAH